MCDLYYTIFIYTYIYTYRCVIHIIQFWYCMFILHVIYISHNSKYYKYTYRYVCDSYCTIYTYTYTVYILYVIYISHNSEYIYIYIYIRISLFYITRLIEKPVIPPCSMCSVVWDVHHHLVSVWADESCDCWTLLTDVVLDAARQLLQQRISSHSLMNMFRLIYY